MKYTLYFKQGGKKRRKVVAQLNDDGLDVESKRDLLFRYIEEHLAGFGINPYYYNIHNASDCTVIDYGSHVNFYHLCPACDWFSSGGRR